MASSNTGGVRPMAIGGRMVRERERLIGMTDEERAWRARYLKSQILAPEEPIIPEGFEKEYYNPFRRFYRMPLNKVESLLTPAVGEIAAGAIRGITAKMMISIIGIYWGWYYLKYNTSTWMRESGWRVVQTRDAVLPGAKNYAIVQRPKQFATDGFEKSPI